MRILLTGNSPFCQTGYGVQAAQLALCLKQMGHEPAIFAYYGLGGTKIEWMDIPVYPNPADDYGAEWVEQVYNHFQADCVITLIDIWVMGKMSEKTKWFPWTPVDHDPIPDGVLEVLQKHPGLYKAIAMSRFGEKQIKDNGLDCFYVPHMIDTDIFHPSLEIRKAQRDGFGWTDKFVIGQVGTNVRERKNWTATLTAVSKFSKYHDDVIIYCHTNPLEKRGRHLPKLCGKLGLIGESGSIARFPSMTDMLLLGIPDTTMNAMYNSLDVYLQPSKGEGFGIPIIEAQAAGIPVIVSGNTAMPELCGGGWILKDMRWQFDEQSSWEGDCNPDEIVEYLEEAYQEKKSGKLAERKVAAREKAIEYDYRLVFEKYLKPVLADIEQLIKRPPSNISQIQQPKSSNRTKDYRRFFIPENNDGKKKVIDIGCGLDQPWKPYLEHLGEYTGVDINGNGTGILAMDAHNLAFDDKSFGFAWCCDVLEHCDDPEKVVCEAQRVSEHGAILFCTKDAPEFNLDPEHKVVNIPHSTTKAGHGLITW